MNPVLTSILLPIAEIAGEDFCRLWIDTIILGVFFLTLAGSLVWGRPVMADWIPLDQDERFNPMVHDLRRKLTIMFTCIFFIMFASDLTMALIGSEFGITYVVLNFILPYGSLTAGVVFASWYGEHAWVQSAVKHYGENWEDELFDNGKSRKQRSGEPVDNEPHPEAFDLEEGRTYLPFRLTIC